MFVKSNHGWLLIGHIPLAGEHVSEYLGLKNTRDNRREGNRIKKELENALRAGDIEIEFARRFPNSKHLARLGLKSSEPSIGEFALAWLGEKVKLTASTRDDYESLLSVHLLPHPLANMQTAAIHDGDVSRFIGTLREKQTRSQTALSERRINMVIARLRSIFATAYRRKLVVNDPMRHVENLREKKHDADPFDLDEAQRIIEAGEGWERPFVTTLLFTGMRPGEALALRWDTIDWDHGMILVRQTVSRRYGFGLPKTPGSARRRDDRSGARGTSSAARTLAVEGRSGFPIGGGYCN
jgi:integrase